MLELPMVTLFGIDCIEPKKTLAVMMNARRSARFAELVLMTDTQEHGDLPSGIRYVHRKQSKKKVNYGSVTNNPIDYEMDVLTETYKHVRTPFLLHMEWDSLLANPAAWRWEWLEYDFIGAPWPYPVKEMGFPWTQEYNCVGNGGFALKSRRFCEAVAQLVDRKITSCVSNDRFFGNVCRAKLEAVGMNFASYKEAERFSCENRIFSGQFGLHGDLTLKLNGIDVEALL